MSRLIDTYQILKEQDSETLYLFKSGIFYIFIDKDAEIINRELNLKLTKLNDNIVKCGFPSSALTKYFNLLSNTDYKIKVIDNTNNQILTLKDFSISTSIQDLLNKIKEININSLSVSQAYKFIEEIKDMTDKITY